MGETIASIGLVTSLPRFYACKFPQSDATTRASPPKRGTRKRGGRPCCDFSSRGATTSATMAHLEPTFSQPVDRPAANRATQTEKNSCSSFIDSGSMRLKIVIAHRREIATKKEQQGGRERGTYIWLDLSFEDNGSWAAKTTRLLSISFAVLGHSLSSLSLSLSLSSWSRPSYEDVDVTCASVNTHRWIGLITGIGYKSSSGHPRDRNYF